MRDFSNKSIESLFHALSSSPQGLSQALARKRMRAQGKNQNTESRAWREFKLFIRQFSNPLVLLLVVAVLLSAVLGQASDTLIIGFILIATGTLSFFQERNAGRAVEKLRQLIELKHSVLRGGKEQLVNSREVVPGDVVLLKAGDIIPADCRIIESNELHVNESALTGESFPVEKIAGLAPADAPLNKLTNCLWQSTNVISGTASALVVQTGADTIFGQMAHSLTQTPETAFEKGIKGFGFFLLRITVVLSLLILTTNLYFGKPFFDAILFSLALAVGMAPELLPAIMTFAMSMGAKRMMEKKVIVKKLSSIFNFGEVNVLCTDKTGTITEGVVRIRDVVNPEGTPDAAVKCLACVNATFQSGFQNPIDQSLQALGQDISAYEKLNEVPYDFIRKRLSVAVQHNNSNLIITKGAVENVLDVCSSVNAGGKNEPLDADGLAKLNDRFSGYSRQGYRVLGIATKETDKPRITRDDELDMTFLGFILLEDPLKDTAAASIHRLEQMQVKTKIITGDNQYAAHYVAQQIGIASPRIITGEMLQNMSPEALIVNAATADVFAEIEPHQKERIVRALQKSNFTVAYIGDGINDVAAIHAADTGISTSNAVDVAKEAADFVLLETDLSVLADGILEGRKSFSNSMKYIFITTGATFGNMLSVATASVFLPFLPMLPKQILLTNFLTDFPFLAVASDNVDQEELELPGKWNMPMIRNFMVVFGLHSSLFDFITFYVLFHYFQLRDAPFQTGWFIESVLTELIILFIIRTKKPFLKSRPGTMMLISGLIAVGITILLPVSPLGPALGLTIAHFQQALALAGIILAYIVTADVVKVVFFRVLGKKN